MKIRDYLFVLILICIDQLLKLYIASNFALYESREVIKDFFYINYVQNTGAAWSFGEGLGSLFVIVAIAMSVGIIVYLNKSKDVKWYTKIVMLLIVAGGVGNAIDRIRLGSVIDFLDFYIFGYNFPVFNFADCCITVAMFGLIYLVLTGKE